MRLLSALPARWQLRAEETNANDSGRRLFSLYQIEDTIMDVQASEELLWIAPEEFINTIEWGMIDKSKFLSLSMTTSFTMRCVLYPLTLVRTRIQVQHHEDMYNGTIDAFRKIVHNEGIRGLYRGFWVSMFQVVSGVCYISTYEGARHLMEHQGVSSTTAKAFVGGSLASLVGQTLVVPFDVISQHLMILGQTKTTESTASSNSRTSTSRLNPMGVQVEGRSRAQLAVDIIRAVYRRDGLPGFYRGYLVSLCTYVPSSASWWTFYQMFQDAFASMPVVPLLPHLFVQCLSAMSAGCASCIITNPLDLVRTRVQVHRLPLGDTVKDLLKEEKLRIFTKGLTSRMAASAIYSFAIIFGYEIVKHLSVRDEYKDRIKW